MESSGRIAPVIRGVTPQSTETHLAVAARSSRDEIRRTLTHVDPTNPRTKDFRRCTPNGIRTRAATLRATRGKISTDGDGAGRPKLRGSRRRPTPTNGRESDRSQAFRGLSDSRCVPVVAIGQSSSDTEGHLAVMFREEGSPRGPDRGSTDRLGRELGLSPFTGRPHR